LWEYIILLEKNNFSIDISINDKVFCVFPVKIRKQENNEETNDILNEFYFPSVYLYYY